MTILGKVACVFAVMAARGISSTPKRSLLR